MSASVVWLVHTNKYGDHELRIEDLLRLGLTIYFLGLGLRIVRSFRS